MIELDKIYNMDCTDGIDELPTGYKYCIVTDPPFNVGYHYNEYKDKMDEGEYFEWLGNIVKGYPCVVIHYPEALYKFAFQIGDFPTRVLSWVYNSNTPRQHRDIAFFGITPDLTKVHQPYKNPTDKRIAARIAAGCDGGKMYDWMEVNQVKNVSKKAVGGGNSSMSDAGGSDAQGGWNIARGIYHSGPVHGERYYSNRRHKKQAAFRRL